MTTIIFAAAISVATNLPTVVVEASRLDRTPVEIPSAIRVIDSDAIANSGAGDAIDLLSQQAPELHVRHLGGGNPALAEISLRGYGESGFGRTLVLVDGERLNSADMNRPDLSRIALGSVSKLEILGGPQAVLHGDGASAGVINIITEPQDYDQQSYIEAHVGSFGSAGAAFGTRGGIAADGVKYWADASYTRSDGYRDHSGYDIWNVSGGIKKEWESGTYFRFTGFYGDAQYDLPGALTYSEWKHDPRDSHATEDDYHRYTYGFSSIFNIDLNDENSLKFTGNFSNRKMDAHQKGTGWFSDNEFDIYSFRILGEWINTAELFDFANEFILGAQYAADLLDGTQVSNYSRQSPEYNRQTMDFYAMETFHFCDSLAFQIGGRYSRAWAYNSLCAKDSRNDDLGAFEAALIWNPNDDSKIYLKEARFYRNPFLDEVPGRYDAGYHWVNTEILSPETGWTTELGAEWKITEEFSLAADVYATWLEDEIFYNAIKYNNENCEDTTFRRGCDIRASWERDKVAGVSASASYVKATFDGGAFGHNLVPLVPETTLAINARVWLWDDCFVFGGYRYQSAMYTCSDFNNAYRKLDWYGIFRLGITYTPTFASYLEGLRFTFAIENLFDESCCDYATYGTQFYPGSGRSLSFVIRYEF